jgi:glycosyltransferase involved in cell wall biosynthesis
VLSFLKLTDVVIIPSVFEGFGNIAIEALMQGAMIISSDAGGLKEIIRHGENGFLFPTLNREALLQHLEAIIIDGRTFNREQLMQDFLDRFTLSRQIEEIMSVIEHTSK